VPFRHPDRSHDLATRIEIEVRERLEEAIDYVCLEALVRARRARDLPPPVADNPADRRAYTDNVLAFLRLLRRELTTDLDAEQQRKLAAAGTADDEQSRLVATQVELARLLPDYWQRFDAARVRYLAEPEPTSGREGGSFLGRLFGRR
jgi:hypothetical protein